MRLVLSLLAAAAVAFPAAAHHGWGSYDADAPMTIEGPIEAIAIGNPHGEMVVAHEGRPWVITLAPLSRMRARGATEEALRPGTPVRAFGYPQRDGRAEIRAEWIEAGGRRYGLR
jgi:hypothetical protein